MACRECGYNDCLCSTIKVSYTEQINQLRTRITELEIALKLAQADKVTLIAERDRYRDALEGIIERQEYINDELDSVETVWNIARTALKEGQDD
jgi:hypothetical protein